MDPASIIGTTAASLQFLGVVLRLVANVDKICKSRYEDVSPEIADIDLAHAEMGKVLDAIASHHTSQETEPPDGAATLSLAKECLSLSAELKETVERCYPRQGGTIRILWAAVTMLFKREQVSAMQQRLERLQNLVSLQLASNIPALR